MARGRVIDPMPDVHQCLLHSWPYSLASAMHMLEALEQSALDQRAISKVFVMQYSVDFCRLQAAPQLLSLGMRTRLRRHLGFVGRLMKRVRVQGEWSKEV